MNLAFLRLDEDLDLATLVHVGVALRNLRQRKCFGEDAGQVKLAVEDILHQLRDVMASRGTAALDPDV